MASPAWSNIRSDNTAPTMMVNTNVDVLLNSCDFTPTGIMAAACRGHDRYYNKYINVKKGGIGGVAMLLVGYVAISYLWSYDHIKHDRWRKYH